MKIIFFGSDNFSVASLKALSGTKHDISCVVTQPDKKRGRGLHLEGTAVKIAAQDLGLKIYQPTKINSSEAAGFLNELKADLFIVVAYGQILSQEILDIPRIFAINVHGSLLPKYRGAAPINWVLINAEAITGVTVIKIVKEMDAGPIILKKELDITDEDTAVTLENKLACLGAEALLAALKLIEDNSYKLSEQDKNAITLARRMKKEDGLINWDKSAGDINNLIRGCIGWPGAFTYYKGKLLKIYKAAVTRSQGHPSTSLGTSQVTKSPGEIMQVSGEGIVVACAKDNLLITEMQLEGKRGMTAQEFISGHKISVGETLGKKYLQKE